MADDTTTRVPERCHDEAPGPLGTGLYCGRLAGHDGQHGHGVYKWASTAAPVTAEGLRETLIDALLDAWKLPQATRSRITREAAARDVDTLLAALACDPGDLPARMAEAMRVALVTWSEGTQHEHLANAALSVRDELVAHLAARVGDAERRAEHAEGEHQVTQDRLAEAKAIGESRSREIQGLLADLDTAQSATDAAEAERDALNACIRATRSAARIAREVGDHRKVVLLSDVERLLTVPELPPLSPLAGGEANDG